MTAPAAMAAVWSQFPAVGLDQLNAAAALTQRVDTKYLVPVAVLARVLEQLRTTHACLDIEGRRQFSYLSTYADSPELGCFHDHRRGVRRRWKARRRVYEDSGQARWEVKFKDGRGLTVKHALPLTPDTGGAVTVEMHTFLDDLLLRHYARPAPAVLEPTLDVRYRRSTLTQPGHATRITVDTELQMHAGVQRAVLRPELALVETKSLSGRSAADRALRAAGARPCSVSKYCAGIALLHPTLPSHPWRQLLNRSFLPTHPQPDTCAEQELAA